VREERSLRNCARVLMAPTRPASARPSDKDEYAENPLARRRGARAERPERRAIGPESRRHRRRRRRLELTEKSYAALTVDNDARRSGVHQTTIYRRWKDRESLVAGAEADLAATRVLCPMPVTSMPTSASSRSLVRYFNSPTGKPSSPRSCPTPPAYRRSQGETPLLPGPLRSGPER